MPLSISSLPSLNRCTIFTVACLAMLGPLVQAQDEENVSISFYTLSWKGSIKDLVYFNKGQSTSLFIPNGAPSIEQRYSGPPKMNFFSERTGPEGEALYDIKASVTIPRGSSRLLLVFIPSASANNPQQAYKILPLPDASANSNFVANAFNFYNLTSTDMAIRVGEVQFQLAPERNHIVTLADTDTQNVDVQMATSTRESKQWTMIYQSRWASPKKRRAWVFIYGEPGTTPTIRKYYQILSSLDSR